VSVSKARPRGAPSKSMSGSSGRRHVTASSASSHRVFGSFSVFSPPLAPYWLALPPWPFSDLRGFCDGAWLHDLSRVAYHSCSSIAFRVYPEPSCHGPPLAPCIAVSRSPARSSWRRYGPPMNFLTLQRRQNREATYTGITSPGCAASSGFLNLSTLSSALILSALFHADAAQVSTFRVFPFTIASCASRHLLPLLLLVGSVQGPPSPASGIHALVKSVPTKSVLPEAW